MTTEKTDETYRLGGSPAQGLVMGTWGFFIGFAAVALYGPAATYFRQQMGLSGLSLGLLVAAPQLTGSLLRIPFGAWVDQVGGRRPMLALFALSMAGMAGLVVVLTVVKPLTASYYPLVLALGFLSGCGVASFSVGIPQVAYWHPQRLQGTALGAYGGYGNLAPGLFTLILPFAIAAWGLAGCYLAWLVFLAAGAALYAAFARDAYYFQLLAQGLGPERSRELARERGQELFPKGSVSQALAAAAGTLRTWGLVALYAVSFGGFLALTVWFPVYWASLHGLTGRQAGLLGGVGFSLVAALSRVVGGRLAERFGGEAMSLWGYSGILVGALALVVSTSFPADAAGELILAVAMGLANAAVFKMVPKFVPEAVGGASGLVGGLGAVGGFVLPPLLGVVVDARGARGYADGFAIFVVLALVGLGVSGLFQGASHRAPAALPAGGRA